MSLKACLHTCLHLKQSLETYIAVVVNKNAILALVMQNKIFSHKRKKKKFPFCTAYKKNLHTNLMPF